MTILTACSDQWMTRPADERFETLPEMHRALTALKDSSKSKAASSKALEFVVDADSPRHETGGRTGLFVQGQNGTPAALTNWSFGQMAGLAGAPAGYLRKLPAELAAQNLNYGMRYARETQDIGVLLTCEQETGNVTLRAATGPNYGRIHNADVTGELIKRFGDGRTGDFRVPGEFGKEVQITKDNTTLYAGDRDMFVFLADEKNRLEVKDRRYGETGSLARGFFVWNSEVGSRSIGVAFFLFDFVCMNRIVWGVREYTERRIRHTISAPERWADDITPLMHAYAESSAQPIEDTIRAAQAKKLEDADKFLANKFGPKMVSRLHDRHLEEEGRPVESLWDATTAVTAIARDIRNQDERVDLERKGGALLDLVAA